MERHSRLWGDSEKMGERDGKKDSEKKERGREGEDETGKERDGGRMKRKRWWKDEEREMVEG